MLDGANIAEVKKLLIIAGSDSGGGAGIQADIKTACAHGVFATTAITALTAQNTLGVQGIFDTPPEFIAKQISSILSDIGTDAVKIGMLSSAAIIEVIFQQLSNSATQQPIILDTVMIAKGGAALLQNDAVKALKEKLIPLAFLVTPNIPEAEVLAGFAIKNQADMERAGHRILEMGARNVLIKGGHLDSEEIIDVLIMSRESRVENRAEEIHESDHATLTTFKSPRIKTNNTHGTGCTLASAIACNVALGQELKDAVAKAREYVFTAIRSSPDIGSGHGPLNHSVEI